MEKLKSIEQINKLPELESAFGIYVEVIDAIGAVGQLLKGRWVG